MNPDILIEIVTGQVEQQCANQKRLDSIIEAVKDTPNIGISVDSYLIGALGPLIGLLARGKEFDENALQDFVLRIERITRLVTKEMRR